MLLENPFALLRDYKRRVLVLRFHPIHRSPALPTAMTLSSCSTVPRYGANDTAKYLAYFLLPTTSIPPIVLHLVDMFQMSF